jgi:hypothetical protein
MRVPVSGRKGRDGGGIGNPSDVTAASTDAARID